jgi:hypothetical protein
LYKLVIFLYLVITTLYLLFTRQPDVFDSETTIGTIQFRINSVSNKTIPFVHYTIGKTYYTLNASYPLRHFKQGQKVTIIYDTSKPARAAIYVWWGYWLQWDELIASILIAIALWSIALILNKNPTEASKIEQMKNLDNAPQRKYN